MVKKVKGVKEEVAMQPTTMLLVRDRDIAEDFSTKVYSKFDQIIKSIILFGSTVKETQTPESDIDLIIIVDDVSVKWDEELIAWYREELGKIIENNPYIRQLHVNTVKLSTWWDDLMKGDPVVMNVLRYGETIIDYGGFFKPLRVLLKEGKIRSTPEAIYNLLQRAPNHMTRARQAMLSSIDGLYWTLVDSAHAALIAADIMPASPEYVAQVLTETFVKTNRLNKKYIKIYEEIHGLAKGIVHGTITHFEPKHLDDWFKQTDAFLGEMARLVKEDVEIKKKSNLS